MNIKAENLIPNVIKNGVAIIKAHIATMPASPGVYKMLNAEGKPVYIGKAKNLPKRVVSYTKIEALPNRLRRMVSLVSSMEFIVTNTEAEALLLEASLIKSCKPVYNIQLRDDKSFPYILIEESHPYPRITKYRGKRGDIKGSYYGPFASAKQVNDTIAELQKLFQIRPCSDAFFASRTRPCLQHQIKRCLGPCVGRIDGEEYKKLVKQMKSFLEGKSTEVQDQLIVEMQLASDNLQFEKAALLRDRIKSLTQIQAKNIFSETNISDADLFALYCDGSGQCALQVFFIRGGKSYGNKVYYYNVDTTAEEVFETFLGQFYQRNHPPKQILLNLILPNASVVEEALYNLHKEKVKITTPKNKSSKGLIEFALDNAKIALERRKRERMRSNQGLKLLGELLGLDELPARVEVYDNSHTFGEKAVGCMVVATPEGFEKGSYRKFNIKDVSVGDDFAMLREVLTRRLKKLTLENQPQIMVIDGGKGQLSSAQSVFSELEIDNIKLIAISKGPNRNARQETLHFENRHVDLPKDSPLLMYLQLIRDEVHNYAIRAHRARRDKKTHISILDDVVSVGVKRKKILLQHFGSVEQIRIAAAEDLAKVPGIDKKTAQKVFDYLHNEYKS